MTIDGTSGNTSAFKEVAANKKIATRKIAVIGPGRLGQAITCLLRQQGYPISAIIGRDLGKTKEAAKFIGAELMASTDINRCAPADIIFITTADDTIASVAQQLQQIKLRPGVLLIHCSGLHTAAILADSNPDSPLTLAMHPLQTFASAAQGSQSLPDCYFSLEGDEQGIAVGQRLVKDIGAQAFIIPAHSKVLYHTAACMVSNFVTTLFDSAGKILADCNPAQQIPASVLGPLLRTAVENSLTMGSETALTGPIVRGDSNTVEQHLNQLQQQQPQFVELYRNLGLQTVELAQRSQRLSDSAAQQLITILTP